MGFFTRIFLTASSSGGSDSDLFKNMSTRILDSSIQPTHHSLGGTTFTIPACIPYLSIFLMKAWKSRNWSIVWGTPVSLSLHDMQYDPDLVCETCRPLTGLKTGILPPP